MKIGLRLLIFLSLNLTGIRLMAQSSVQVSVQLLTPDLVGRAVVEIDSQFTEWIQSQTKKIQSAASNIKGNADLHVVYSLQPKGKALFQIHSRPALDPEQRRKLFTNLGEGPTPNTKFSNYDFVIMARINDGMDEETPFVPPLSYPYERQLAEFEKKPIIEQKELLHAYIEQEAIPLLVFYAGQADEQFLGVRWISSFLNEGKYKSQALDSILYNKAEYWRAVMEMEPGNQLVPFTAMCLHLYRQEYDRAERLNFLIGMFSKEGTLPALLSDQIQPRLRSLNANLSSEIEKGLALHDAGLYNQADSLYAELLKESLFPNSAWLKYESYYSRAASLNPDQVDSLWYKNRPEIYACDPLYPMDIRARTGKEAYLMMRRQGIQNLFTDPDSYRADFTKYADIALDLGVYSFAAQLYWMVLSHLNKADYQERNVLAHYLYALEKMKITSIKENFEMNYEQEFSLIEQEREKLMKESGIYQAFRN